MKTASKKLISSKTFQLYYLYFVLLIVEFWQAKATSSPQTSSTTIAMAVPAVVICLNSLFVQIILLPQMQHLQFQKVASSQEMKFALQCTRDLLSLTFFQLYLMFYADKLFETNCFAFERYHRCCQLLYPVHRFVDFLQP